ncbi:MAG: hypothetical protein GWP09_02780 [Nitrospiraceae bacterium]|nr:hypothetical protein [Nitrospiraceae bacterium]
MSEKSEVVREYNVPLRKDFLKAPMYRRAKRAVSSLRQFIVKHMKNENVVISNDINMFIWQRGIKHPPHHVPIKVTVKEGKVYAELNVAKSKREGKKVVKSNQKYKEIKEREEQKVKEELEKKEKEEKESKESLETLTEENEIKGKSEEKEKTESTKEAEVKEPTKAAGEKKVKVASSKSDKEVANKNENSAVKKEEKASDEKDNKKERDNSSD